MPTNQQLYRPYDADLLHPDLYELGFEAGAVNIRLRPFYIPEDFHLFNEWINHLLYPDNLSFYPPISSFTESYFKAIMESFNAQCIWGLINDEPGFSMEIYEAVDYPIDFANNIRLKRGDIILDLIINPLLFDDRPKLRCILPACLGYLRKHADSNKIVWLIDQEDKHYHELAIAAQPVLNQVIEKNKQLWVFE